jgi:hypothetical protein
MVDDNDTTFTLPERVSLNKIKASKRSEEKKMPLDSHDVDFAVDITGTLNVQETVRRKSISYKELAEIALGLLPDEDRQKAFELYRDHESEETQEVKAVQFMNKIKENLPKKDSKRISKSDDFMVRKIG